MPGSLADGRLTNPGPSSLRNCLPVRLPKGFPSEGVSSVLDDRPVACHQLRTGRQALVVARRNQKVK